MQKFAVGQDTPEGTPCGGESTPAGGLQANGAGFTANCDDRLTSTGAVTVPAE